MIDIFRDYECDGGCGVLLPIPAECAAILLFPNGDKRPDASLVCGECQEWLDKVTDDAELINVANKALRTRSKPHKVYA